MSDTTPRSDQSDAMNDLPAISVSRPYLAIVLNLLIMIAGIGAIMGVEVRELPDVDRPIVTVRGDYPGASPETLDAEVTSVVEAAVARVNGVKEVRASSEENNFRIRVVFSPSTNLSDAATDVREAVSRSNGNCRTGSKILRSSKPTRTPARLSRSQSGATEYRSMI